MPIKHKIPPKNLKKPLIINTIKTPARTVNDAKSGISLSEKKAYCISAKNSEMCKNFAVDSNIKCSKKRYTLLSLRSRGVKEKYKIPSGITMNVKYGIIKML